MIKRLLTCTAIGKILLFVFPLLLGFTVNANAAYITLQWDANDPTPDEYHLYQRQAGQEKFEAVWAGRDTTHTVDGLIEGITYYFVVRAFQGSAESADSNALQYTLAASAVTTGSSNGNLSDVDSVDQNSTGPVLSQPVNSSTGVGLTPTLTAEAFSDARPYRHAQTCYQISTGINFESLVFEKTSSKHLTSLLVPNMILEPDTTYYWRVKFIDQDGIESKWSDIFEFTTIDFNTIDDADGNGILDSQEIHQAMDLDNNGVEDALQSDLQGVKTSDPSNPFIAVKRLNENVQIGTIRSLDADQLPAAANQPDELTSIISFKLYLLNDTTTATITIFFSEPAPPNALWYKYDPNDGWEAYNQALFSADRKSVTLTLTDGGIGDQDGVKNGIIIDPAGLGYIREPAESVLSTPAEASGSGCFITTQQIELSGKGTLTKIFLALFLIGLGLVLETKVRRRNN